MTHVVFVAPFALEATCRFAQAAASLPGVRLSLVSQHPAERFPGDLRRDLAGHWRVDRVLDPNRIAEAVRELEKSHGPAERLLGTLEQLQIPLALVREAFGIEGMRPATALGFRDKARMKATLVGAGLPVADHSLCASADDARAFVERVGLPVVFKPLAGTGARSVYAVTKPHELDTALAALAPEPRRPILGEELVAGNEHTLDAVVLGGRTVWSFVTDFLPGPLDAIRNPWIQWCVLLPREAESPELDAARHAGARALDALGLRDGVAHLEWFRRDDGSVVLSEAAARPGGGRIWDLVSRAGDFDFPRAWARVMIQDRFEPPEQRWATGCAFLRGQGRGHVRAVHGLETAQEEVGPLVVDARLPQVGQPPSGSHEGEGWVVLRHRDTGVVRRALELLISTVRVELG